MKPKNLSQLANRLLATARPPRLLTTGPVSMQWSRSMISTSSSLADRHTTRTTAATHAHVAAAPRSSGHTPDDIRRLAEFIRSCEGKLTVITGAGVSTPSNIPDYRGPNGAYVKNKDYKPIQYQEFMGAHSNRQRYWARSMLGYGTVYNAQPNTIHTTLANWQRQRLIDGIITQNVDSLHLKAGAISHQTLELHGTLATVTCQSCTHTLPRSTFQSTLLALNPAWANHSLPVSEQVKSVIPPSHKSPGEGPLSTLARPDGDTENTTNLEFSTFNYPACPSCGTGVLKPGVVFFGENIAPSVKERAMSWVKEARGVLVLGTTLTTYSAYRLVKEVVEGDGQGGRRKRQAWCVNEGRTRADGMWTGGKVEGKVQEVLREVERELGRRVE